MTESLKPPPFTLEEGVDYKEIEKKWVMNVLGPALFDENNPQHHKAVQFLIEDFMSNLRLEDFKTNFEFTLTPPGKEHHTRPQQANVANKFKAGTMMPWQRKLNPKGRQTSAIDKYNK